MFAMTVEVSVTGLCVSAEDEYTVAELCGKTWRDGGENEAGKEVCKCSV